MDAQGVTEHAHCGAITISTRHAIEASIPTGQPFLSRSTWRLLASCDVPQIGLVRTIHSLEG